MTASAIVLLVLSLVIVWGGLAVSIAMLARTPERSEWPQGWSHEAERLDAKEAAREAEAPTERDT
ncbi:methionine/alanine import family NSS transporter small subunit [Antribacter gilvus]|uniref:methionine/alanine import family NSS transporter small subunit n=1 Tax=Antribacter gilvus TaxID=2304675 RepID=UPI000F7937E5|nr:methionine/alanine import family NSS transporter small subunit [Antribacter gilvus]